MIVLAGGDVVLPHRILANASLVIDGQRIAAVDARAAIDPGGAAIVDATGCYVVPGFVDVHVHGVEGIDTLDGGAAVQQISQRLPRYGVTAFCPTTVACSPADLRMFLAQLPTLRAQRAPGGARVLPAHLESNFINDEFRGAQPAACLRVPDARGGSPAQSPGDQAFSTGDILDIIASARPDIGIVTLAPELSGGIELVRTLVAAGHRVSLGHSGADFDLAVAAIDAGARHATHLFNRMRSMSHRAPGLPGAVLSRADIAAELICDGYHVHPAMARVAIAAKGVDRVMAITDGTGASGLPVGARARLGGRAIRAGEDAAFLDDGTLAGSTLTMDVAFGRIVHLFGASVAEAAVLCSTTPARELGLAGLGMIAEGAWADVTVLDRAFGVRRTFIAGKEVYARPAD